MHGSQDMMRSHSFINVMATIPESITFEQAISFTQSFLSEAQSELSASEIAQLVKTENGARGFFATYLTSDSALASCPTPEIIQALRSQKEIVSELLVKNLAMSTAQALFHRRRQDEEMARASQRVQERTAQLIKLVDLDLVYEKSQQLIETIKTSSGSYQAFLERWNYDFEQKQAINEAMQQLTNT